MCSEPEKVQSQKRFKSQQIQLPHDIASRTAHTAVEVGISPHQARTVNDDDEIIRSYIASKIKESKEHIAR